MHAGAQCVEIRHQDVRMIGQGVAMPFTDVFGIVRLACFVARLTPIRLREQTSRERREGLHRFQ